MKRQLARILIVLASAVLGVLSSSAQTAVLSTNTVVFNFASFGLPADRVTSLTVQAEQWPLPVGNFYTKDPITRSRANYPQITNGAVRLTNLVCGVPYKVTIATTYDNYKSEIFIPTSPVPVQTNADGSVNASFYLGTYYPGQVPSFAFSSMSGFQFATNYTTIYNTNSVNQTNVVIQTNTFIVGTSLVAGSNVTLSTNGLVVTISSTGGSGGSATNVNFLDGRNTHWSTSGGSNVVDVVGVLTNGTIGNALTSSSATNSPNGTPLNSMLTANQTITASGDATGSGTTAITLTLKNTGTAGTYTKPTFDAQGREISGTSAAFSDITGTATPGQLPVATTSAFGAVKPDGSSITISGGVISAPGGGSGTTIGNYTNVFNGVTNWWTGGGSKLTNTIAGSGFGFNYIFDTNGNFLNAQFLGANFSNAIVTVGLQTNQFYSGPNGNVTNQWSGPAGIGQTKVYFTNGTSLTVNAETNSVGYNGPGGGLTGLNGTQITSGTLPDARLSANVALLNADQTFTGNKTFTKPINESYYNADPLDGTFTFSFTNNTTTNQASFQMGASVVEFNGFEVDADYFIAAHDINAAGVFHGNGSGLTNIPVTSITGPVVTNGSVEMNYNLGGLNLFSGGGMGGGGLELTAFGVLALTNSSGSYNNAFGEGALKFNSSGGGNSAFGSEALKNNTTGVNNLAAGGFSLFDNVSGSQNTALGVDALNNASGSWNIGIGYQAGVSNTAGSTNIYIGSFGNANDTNITRIGSSQSDTYLAGIIHGNGSSLTNLLDTNLVSSTASDGNVPTYSAAQHRYLPQAPSGGGSIPSGLYTNGVTTPLTNQFAGASEIFSGGAAAKTNRFIAVASGAEWDLTITTNGVWHFFNPTGGNTVTLNPNGGNNGGADFGSGDIIHVGNITAGGALDISGGPNKFHSAASVNFEGGINVASAYVTNLNGNILHQLDVPVGTNYTVSAQEVANMNSTNITYHLLSSPSNGVPMLFTFPAPPNGTNVQFSIFQDGTNAVTLTNNNSITTNFSIANGRFQLYTNAFNFNTNYGYAMTFRSYNSSNWIIVNHSWTKQSIQDFAATTSTNSVVAATNTTPTAYLGTDASSNLVQTINARAWTNAPLVVQAGKTNVNLTAATSFTISFSTALANTNYVPSLTDNGAAIPGLSFSTMTTTNFSTTMTALTFNGNMLWTVTPMTQ